MDKLYKQENWGYDFTDPEVELETELSAHDELSATELEAARFSCSWRNSALMRLQRVHGNGQEHSVWVLDLLAAFLSKSSSLVKFNFCWHGSSARTVSLLQCLNLNLKDILGRFQLRKAHRFLSNLRSLFANLPLYPWRFFNLQLLISPLNGGYRWTASPKNATCEPFVLPGFGPNTFTKPPPFQ